MNDDEILSNFTESYYQRIGESVYPDPVPLSVDKTALVIIDAQKCIKMEYLVKELEAEGIDTKPHADALRLLGENIDGTLKNIARVLAKCREKGIQPIHVKIQSYLNDAKDAGRLHKVLGLCFPPGCEASEFCDEAMPIEGEIVLHKTCSGIHVGTQIDRILRNMGIESIIAVGFYTDQCVTTSVRDLSDLGYDVDLIEDAVGAMSKERHRNALQSIKKLYVNTETTDELLERLSKL